MILSVRKEIRVLFHVFTLPTHCYFSQTHFSSNLIRGSPNLFAIYLSQSFHTLYHIFALEKYKLNNTTSESCVKFIQSISRNYSRRKLINYQPSRKLQFNSIRGGKADEIEGIRSSSRSIKSYTLSILHNPLEFPVEIPNKSLASPSFSIQPSFQPGNYGYVEAPFSIIRSFAIYPVRASRFPTARNNARNNPRLEGERNRLSSLDVSFF